MHTSKTSTRMMHLILHWGGGVRDSNVKVISVYDKSVVTKLFSVIVLPLSIVSMEIIKALLLEYFFMIQSHKE